MAAMSVQAGSTAVSPMSMMSMLLMSAGLTGTPPSTTGPGMAAVRSQREWWQVRPLGRRPIPTITRNADIIRFHLATELID